MDCALQKGLDSFEIYQSLQSDREITWYNEQMDTFVSSSILGTSIRGVKDGNMANMALEQVDDALMESVIDSLIEQIEIVSSEEKDFLRKPEKVEPVEINRIWNVPTPSYVQSVLKEIETKLLGYDRRVLQVAYLSYQHSKGYREITNSYGIDLRDDDEIQYIYASIVVGDNNDVKDAMSVRIIRDFDAFDVDELVSELCDKAIRKLNAHAISSMKTPVIFERNAMRSLFGAYVGLFSGEMIYKGISYLKDKENTKIFSDKITIIDNPKNTDALTVASFDDEGCPTKEKILVENGIYRQCLHSTKSALRMNTISTGNGFKSGYATSVSVQPLNCHIVPGDKSLDQLQKQMHTGLVINNLIGLHAGVDIVSGNFSLQCSGYWVEDGIPKDSITLITVAGNFMELMNLVEEVGNDLDWEYHSITCPSIYFKECAISGE